jgi:hypothetical protein
MEQIEKIDEEIKHTDKDVQRSASAESSSGLLTTQQAAIWLGYRPRMLEARRLKGDGPLFIRISARAVRYRLEDLQNWVNSRLRSSTSEA